MNQLAIMNFENTKIAFSPKSNNDLKQAYFLFSSMKSPSLVKFGTSCINLALKLHLPIEGIIRKTLFRQFCGGVSITDSQSTIETLGKFGVGTILDYSVEGADSKESHKHTVEEVLRTIALAKDNDHMPFCVFKPTGIGSATLMEKIQLKEPLTEAEREEFQEIRNNFDRICTKAHDNDVRLFIDAEDSWYQEPIDMLVYEMMEKHNRKKAIVFNTFQMYRTNMLERLSEAVSKAEKDGYYFGAKLVRGAYMEKERERAEEKGYADPIMPNHEATNKQFDDGIRLCFEHRDFVSVACCSHNESSNKLLAGLIEENDLSQTDPRFYFAQLYGMSDHISYNLAEAGFNVAKYVPYGPVRETMPYLFRRAEENTSVAGQTGRELKLIQQELKRRKNEK
ncbi:proline dehydrogenase [Fulvitalea axinellae]|uniref:Proline dehydrogenase n=1 Tax=Fulvitalea axinellae TaxID=1182444 RepID=A0AAU9DDR6_9BACT|nr:proline dehydrogenase [Fulvitalea axinellae]